MGKYETLGKYLSSINENIIKITFEEIENILGFPLPSSAFKFRPWWANDQSHVQAIDGWMKYGWKLDRVDIFQKNAKFKKITNSYSQYNDINKMPLLKNIDIKEMNPSTFEELSRRIMSEHFGKDFFPGKLPEIPKLFDLVSSDKTIVGDAKYLTMVRGTSIPPAKFATIAEYVWLLEKSHAESKFLVFGNDKRVPVEWIKRYGNLVHDVDFYFIDSNKKLEKIKMR